jgi:hypothetical protein
MLNIFRRDPLSSSLKIARYILVNRRTVALVLRRIADVIEASR